MARTRMEVCDTVRSQNDLHEGRDSASVSTFAGSTAIGAGAVATAVNQLALGPGTLFVTAGSVAVGANDYIAVRINGLDRKIRLFT